MTALDHALKKSEKILASKGASKHACRFTANESFIPLESDVSVVA
jgi:hypothetical protein